MTDRFRGDGERHATPGRWIRPGVVVLPAGVGVG